MGHHVLYAHSAHPVLPSSSSAASAVSGRGRVADDVQQSQRGHGCATPRPSPPTSAVNTRFVPAARRKRGRPQASRREEVLSHHQTREREYCMTKHISRALQPTVLASSILAAISLMAQQAHAQAQADEPKMHRVEVTGSNIKRIEGETALPVTIISREDIERIRGGRHRGPPEAHHREHGDVFGHTGRGLRGLEREPARPRRLHAGAPQRPAPRQLRVRQHRRL